MGDKAVISTGGMGFGTLIAAIVSWQAWGHIGWMILHAFFGWAYIIYYLIKYGFTI